MHSSSRLVPLQLNKPIHADDIALIVAETLDWVRRTPGFGDLERDAALPDAVEYAQDKRKYSQRCYAFTDASLFIREFVDDLSVKGRMELGYDQDTTGAARVRKVALDESSLPLATLLTNDKIFNEATTQLEDSGHWINIRDHVTMSAEDSSRSLIDTVLLCGINLAQGILQRTSAVLTDLLNRHSELKSQRPVSIRGNKCAAWLVLNQQVKVDPQAVGSGIQVHGQLDYVIGVVSAFELYRPLNSKSWLSARHTIGNKAFLVIVTVADPRAALEEPKAFDQALSASVTLLCSTNHNAIVNIISDGRRWKFIHVERVIFLQAASGAIDFDGQPPAKKPRLSGQQAIDAGKTKPKDSEDREKPFRSEMTEELELGKDTQLILKLLTAAILGAPEQFLLLAKMC